MERIDDLRDCGNRLRFGESARSGFDQIDSVSQTITFVAAEEEHLVLHDRTADGTAKLVHSKRKLRFSTGSYTVEEITRIQLVVPEKFKCRSMKSIAAGLRDDADLSPGSGPEFRRVVIRFNAKFLNILEAALKLEW